MPKKGKRKTGQLKKLSATQIPELNNLFDENWVSRHIKSVRPQIAELDRQTMKSIALAPFITVTNSTKK
ncbi:MAG: hypothetical protein A2W64_03765 [Candidatus Zambryskibacteria bacterium RIFCSPLOWO2_02_39_10]|uniref:Uncharacterized protein n=1 Tax=Candidatus Zambryskibacteria bacterium RIFCSPLOWO2_12_39_8 TaxID=1802774 RepID=A0A1G2UW51_9BACT|nr:MAG: hypothetical protein A2W64_03765 [Candidatus Zambryskibacteria bacterium RIFCSPLOWO2_02_39_10]OHB13613.1 MAG: hypothetical protein A2Y49_02335 [Candidatus Zambryskibacteria bacterium RIFCSPLOWO2_12_39_8]